MGDSLSVHTGELDAGAGRILGLVDTAKSTATSLDQSLAGMAGAAGHPDVAGALAQVADAATKAMLDMAALLGFIGQNLKQTASSYDRTETDNARNLHQVKGAS